jgi:hypothetical protein
MKKSQLKDKVEYLEGLVLYQQKIINILCGEDEFAIAQVKFDRKLQSDLFDAIWKGGADNEKK